MLARIAIFIATIGILAHTAGCVAVVYEDDTRRVFIMRGLTDTGIESFTASTPNGTAVNLTGYTSDQAKAIDLARAALEAAK